MIAPSGEQLAHRVRWPRIVSLDAPAGVNATLSDFVPIIGLIGKSIYGITGAQTNLYGAILFLCLVLPGVMMTLVLIAAKIRFALAAISSTAWRAARSCFARATPASPCTWSERARSPSATATGT